MLTQTANEFSYVQLHELSYQGTHTIAMADNNFLFINYLRCYGLKDEGTQNVQIFGRRFLRAIAKFG